MEQRRVELRMSWREVSTAADMSYEGLRAIRKGDRQPNAVTRGRIEDALQWAPGSVEAIQAGGQPTPISSGTSEGITELRAELQQMERQLAEMQERIRRMLGEG